MGRRKKQAKDQWDGEWEPTADMRNYFRAWKENLSKPNSEILATCGLTNHWYYDVFQNDERAQDWFKHEREKFLGGDALVSVHKQIMVQASSQSPYQHHFAKLALQRFDPEFKERKEVSQTLNVRLQGGIPAEERVRVLAAKFQRALPKTAELDVVEGEIVKPISETPLTERTEI
jgi:hypothetical protein